jgi:regulator of protease activity HflC (stomatin/prohibitin superfamily)
MIAEILIIVGLIIGFVFAFMHIAAVQYVTYIALLIVVIGLFFKFFVKKYDEFERGIVFRLGKFNRIGGPGWTIVIPFFEKEYQRVDVRTKMLELFIPVAFTEDDLRIKVDGTVFYRIIDPNKALLNIDNYMSGLENLIQSETRNLIASLTMRQVFARLDALNDLLADKIRHATWKWGIDIPMVQIRGIMPPEEIAVAMQEKEIAAQSMQAQKFRAEAKKVVMEAIGQGAKSLDDRAITYLYIKALEEMSKGSATKIVFPMQFMNAMKGFGEGMGMGTGLGAGMDVRSAIDAVKEKISSA